ncbi:MAG: hypothetical protein NTW91_02330 [Verrucomicrobia bacterium]|nr:hypothetical protein [Verrucomicrobiota bacterium]
MSATPSNGSVRSHRNRTVLAALWALAIVALIEVVLAAVALAPRLASGLRQGSLQGTEASSMSAPFGAGATLGPAIPAPVKKPLESSRLNEILNAQATEKPFTPGTSDSTMPGAPLLQILNARLEGNEEGSKKLQVTIKSSPKETIDVPQVKVQVYFYDEDNGEIVPSKAQVTSSWTSPPVDWRNGEPELLEVRYLPESADPGMKFTGYLIAVYYKGDLQDCRADPPRLKKLFEPKYYIGSDE